MEVREESECLENVKKLVVIQYPGVVSSVDNMLKTLGGIGTINEVNQDSTRRMELRFRPGDVYCRPTCGERHATTGLLVTIKRKKKKAQFVKPGDDVCSIMSTLVGVVHTKYSFENLCDFQYLPVERKLETNQYKRLEELIPRSITPSSWLDADFPLFLPPAVFTRMDIPQEYHFRSDVNDKKFSEKKSGTLYRTRQKRKHHAILMHYQSGAVPGAPKARAMSQIRSKQMEEQLFTSLTEVFKERPLWSKNALKGKYGFSGEKLTIVLPCVAFYFKTGPWGKLWSRLGYDPRTDSTSWIYQTFDYRVRQTGGVKSKVKAKRRTMDCPLPYKSVNLSKRKRSMGITLHGGPSTSNDQHIKSEPLHNSDRLYIFREDTIPPYRQMFYQYCDIDVPQIQKLLENAILSMAEPICNEKSGWLPIGIDDQCRNIVSKMVEKTLLEKCLDPSTFDENLSNEESDDMDE